MCWCFLVKTLRFIVGIKEKVWKKILQNSFLSPAGEEILIEVLLQSTSTYTVNVFSLPENLCKAINGS